MTGAEPASTSSPSCWPAWSIPKPWRSRRRWRRDCPAGARKSCGRCYWNWRGWAGRSSGASRGGRSLEELYDEEGELGSLVEHLNEWWTEALLTADLTPDERQDWAESLREWQQTIEDSDKIYDQSLKMAVTAAEQGWDYPPLVRVLQGEITQQGAWEGEAPHYADELAVARLNILQRQGRVPGGLFPRPGL